MASTEEGGAPLPQPPPQVETLAPPPPSSSAAAAAARSSAPPPQGQGDTTEDEEEEEEEDSSAVKTLEVATELFNKGSKAVEDGDFVEAVDCLSRALEIRVEHYGEVAPECAISYYKYGCALLYKSQEEADPLGASEKDQEDDNEGSDGDGEELAEGDEDDSDLDLAWKMLDVARAIVEKCPEDNIEKVNIFSALGEVSLEREDFETSLNDYLKALSILERMAEPDNRRMVELNFRICLVLEVWSKVEEAIPYCQKAISLCKSHLMHLSEDAKPTALSDKNGNIVNDSGTGGNQASGKGDANPSIEDDEKAAMSGILIELERKLEDLQHVLSNPKSIFSEIMKMVSSRSASAEVNLSNAEPASASAPASLTSSQMGGVSGGFDSPTISTAATNAGGITHLGVVGRGVKRASLNPIGAEPSSKKLSSDSSYERDGSSVSEVVDSAVATSKTPKE